MNKALLLFLLGLAACHSENVTLKPGWYHNNGADEQLTTITRHDAFATYLFETNAPELTVHAGTSLAPTFAALGQIVAYVDGTPWRTFHVGPDKKVFTLRLDSVPGSHRVALVEGSAIRAHEQGEIGATSITGVSVPEGFRVDSVPKKYTAGLVVWGDSRTCGGGCSIPAVQAWPVLLRKKLPTTEVFTPGYGSLDLGAHAATEAQCAALVTLIAKRLHPYSIQTVWLETGVNSYLSNTYTPTQLSSYYQALLRALHNALPQAKIILQTDVTAATETPNKLGFSLQDYRDGETAAAAGLPYVQVLDGRQLGTVADLSPDGVHLSEAGESQFAMRAYPILR